MISKLKAKVESINNKVEDIQGLLSQGIEELFNLNTSYRNGDFERFRSIIGSMYPENFTFSENLVRTARVNEVVQLIYLINNELGPIKNGTKKNFSSLSRQVVKMGLFSNHFMQDLKKLVVRKAG